MTELGACLDEFWLRSHGALVSLLGNLVWLVCGGLLSALVYILGGVLMCLTVVGIPFGVQAMKLGAASLAPFGKTLETEKNADNFLNLTLNLIWLLLFGWEIALWHLVWALLLGVTIIGIPFAKQHLKLIPIALLPLGRSLV